jgi:hypothetical protein
MRNDMEIQKHVTYTLTLSEDERHYLSRLVKLDIDGDYEYLPTEDYPKGVDPEGIYRLLADK